MEELAHVWRRELSADQEAIAARWAGDLLLGADQPSVVAFEQNRKAMGNSPVADFRDTPGTPTLPPSEKPTTVSAVAGWR